MRYIALASDYDGTLAHDGVVDEETIRALQRLVHSGRKLILVTGRELPDLQAIFPQLDLCERVVAENGAILYNPATREKRTLAAPPPKSFSDDLRNRGVSTLSQGEVIIATWRPFEREALEAIQHSGLELQITFNKDAVMILPSGTNKKTGLCFALEELSLSSHNVIGIGDAENDHAFLEYCECSVAVANAIPSLKERADATTEGARGAGVMELIEKLISNDASNVGAELKRHSLCIGKAESGDVTLPSYGQNVLVCGESGGGKSTVVTGLLERIVDRHYQICLIDPEGDYENLQGFQTVGDEKHAPSLEHVNQVLEAPNAQVIVNLVGVAASDRPTYFASSISKIQARRLQTGRPHWLVIDEAHHVLPSEWALAATAMPAEFCNLMLVSVHPGHVSPTALRKINTVLMIGREPKTFAEEFAGCIQIGIPDMPSADLARGEVLLWSVDRKEVSVLKVDPPRADHYRHRRKYAEGQLEPERVFHFRGPAGKTDLRAQNLNLFIQIGDGVDDETWLFHLHKADYSRWIADALGDKELAEEIAKTEQDSLLSARESRDRVRSAILQKYTAPA